MYPIESEVHVVWQGFCTRVFTRREVGFGEIFCQYITLKAQFKRNMLWVKRGGGRKEYKHMGNVTGSRSVLPGETDNELMAHIS
jgi:hypothetical protein